MALKARKKRERNIISNINVVPYIDVMLVLLIIFMITTPMLTQGVKVNLPKASAKSIAPTPEKPLILTVNKKGEYFSNMSSNAHIPISMEGVRSSVYKKLQQNKTLQVYVRGDSGTTYGQVVGLMVTLQKVGVKNVGLVTNDVTDKKF
jgi:biopolymer transport protein TolR